jgi:hypothetical protein
MEETPLHVMQVVDEQQAQAHILHRLAGFDAELGRIPSRSDFASQGRDDGRQELWNPGPVRRLDQRDGNPGPLGLRIFRGRLSRLEPASDGGLAVVRRADDQQIVRPHAALRAQNLLQPRMHRRPARGRCFPASRGSFLNASMAPSA